MPVSAGNKADDCRARADSNVQYMGTNQLSSYVSPYSSITLFPS